MSPNSIAKPFTKHFFISSAESDFTGKLNLSALVNILIQSASAHAEEIGWGFEALRRDNMSWVLSSLHIEINRFPRWQENIRCETWPRGSERLFYLRDFIIYDKNGNDLVKASSNWLIIDTEKRRPKFRDLNLEGNPHVLSNCALANPIPKLANVFDGEDSFVYEPKLSDIDINQHITATRYVDLILDTFSLDEFQSMHIKKFTVNYIREVNFGEKVIINRKFVDGLWFFGLCPANQCNVKQYCSALLG